METPNLDAMPREELRDFWREWHVTTKRRAVVFTGERKDARQIMETLACYAINKSCALERRLEGKIVQAMRYEEACELQYQKLPVDVRW